MDQTKGLLQTAKDLELNVTGVAFHVGSGASDPAAYTSAVNDARAVFDTAQTMGFDMRTLDVGGGFIYDTFEPMAAVLSDALAEHFPPHIRIIGEPGRFYVSGAFTIACNVIARRTVEDPQTAEKSYMLYLNDGVYGNFSSIMFDHQHPVPQILSCSADTAPQQKAFSAGLPTPPTSAYPSPESSQENLTSSFADLDLKPADHREQMTTYSIWGPTCDGIDCISPSVQFPANKPLDVGDWLFFEEMGAYTKCSATRFNGFTDKHDTVYVSSEAGVGKLAGF